jgi:quinol-cytochrome oxidoreductase complex cytochrome b subunit
MIKGIRSNSFMSSRHSRPPEDRHNSHRIFRTLVFHIRPRMVPERTLRFTLTWGLGGSAVVLVVLQLFTGILLKFAYEPFPNQAYNSLIRLQEGTLFGQFIRNMHFWSANLLVGVLFLHALRVFFTGAYRPPRRVNWIVGLCLLLTVLASNLTGYLLPWDQLAYWATTICLGMLEYIPGLGNWLQLWIMGGPQMGPATLRNFYAIHTAALPAVIVSLMAYHFWRIRKAGGLVIPRSPHEELEETPVTVPSNPHLLLREAAVALAVIAFVLVVSLIFDTPMGQPANPGLSPNPTKAPWYFAGVQETLIHFHPSFALLMVMVLTLGACFVLPYLKHPSVPTGVWFASNVGRRMAFATAAAAVFVTPLAVILDEYLLDFAGWMPDWPQAISNGVIPMALFASGLAGLYFTMKRGFRASLLETIQAVVVFLVVMFVMLTLICAGFRGEGMKLIWPL